MRSISGTVATSFSYKSNLSAGILFFFAAAILLILIRYGGDGSVEFRQMDREGLVVGFGPVSQIAQRDGLTQPERCVGVASPVDSGMNSVAEGDIVAELVQFSVDGELSAIGTGVGDKLQPVTGRHQRVGQNKAAIEKEFQNGDARAPNRAVAGGIGRMSRRSLRERL